MSTPIITNEIKAALMVLMADTEKAIKEHKSKPIDEHQKWKAKRVKLYGSQQEHFMSCNLGHN